MALYLGARLGATDRHGVDTYFWHRRQGPRHGVEPEDDSDDRCASAIADGMACIGHRRRHGVHRPSPRPWWASAIADGMACIGHRRGHVGHRPSPAALLCIGHRRRHGARRPSPTACLAPGPRRPMGLGIGSQTRTGAPAGAHVSYGVLVMAY